MCKHQIFNFLHITLQALLHAKYQIFSVFHVHSVINTSYFLITSSDMFSCLELELEEREGTITKQTN